MSRRDTAPHGRGGQHGRALLAVLVVLLLIAAVAVWWSQRPEAIPDQVREVLPKSALPAVPDPTLYKWKDDQGRWNITDQPPKDRKYEAIKVDPDTNVLPAGVAPEQD